MDLDIVLQTFMGNIDEFMTRKRLSRVVTEKGPIFLDKNWVFRPFYAYPAAEICGFGGWRQLQ